MKINNIKLIGLLVALVAVYFAVDIFGSKKKSKSLRSELVAIDTTAVTGLEVMGTQDNAVLNIENESWMITLANGKKVTADKQSVKRSLEALMNIKPARLATRKQEKWEEYQVADTMGTRVKVMEGDEVTLDIILGKLGVTGQRSYHTFVRLAEDDEVYLVDNFMSFNVPADPNSYRNTNVAQINKEDVTKVKLTYPGDSSLNLEKMNDKWFAAGAPADSTKMAQYLRGLNYLTSRNFLDDENNWGNPSYQASIVLVDGSEVTLDGYVYNNQLVFNSSENKASYFADSTLLTKVFKGLPDLL